MSPPYKNSFHQCFGNGEFIQSFIQFDVFTNTVSVRCDFGFPIRTLEAIPRYGPHLVRCGKEFIMMDLSSVQFIILEFIIIEFIKLTFIATEFTVVGFLMINFIKTLPSTMMGKSLVWLFLSSCISL